MNQTLQHTVIETLDYLMALVREGTRPEDAQAGLRTLQRKHSEITTQLVWEEETYDRSVHYDALLSLPENGTISISYVDERAKPWPLRGVLRWSDAELARVNNTVLSVDQAIACLDFIWDEAQIIDRLVNVCLIQEELEKHPFDVADRELQLAMNAFRRARKLYKAEDTRSWLERRGLSHAELERMVANQARIAKLRDKLIGDALEKYFDTHSSDFDTAYVARIFVPDEAWGLALCEDIRAGAVDFFEAAQRRFVDSKQSRRGPGTFFTAVQRREAPLEIQTSLFQASAGAVLGPVHDREGCCILRVLSVVRAQLDETTREAIKTLLFEKWLEERRQEATIEWFWGNAKNTGQAAHLDAGVNTAQAGRDI